MLYGSSVWWCSVACGAGTVRGGASSVHPQLGELGINSSLTNFSPTSNSASCVLCGSASSSFCHLDSVLVCVTETASECVCTYTGCVK